MPAQEPDGPGVKRRTKVWRYQLVLRVHDKGTPAETAIVAVHEAYYDSPHDVEPEEITRDPVVDAWGDTVQAVTVKLRHMAKAADYPLLNWAAFGKNPTEADKFAFLCTECRKHYTAPRPLLSCPVNHAPS